MSSAGSFKFSLVSLRNPWSALACYARPEKAALYRLLNPKVSEFPKDIYLLHVDGPEGSFLYPTVSVLQHEQLLNAKLS